MAASASCRRVCRLTCLVLGLLAAGASLAPVEAQRARFQQPYAPGTVWLEGRAGVGIPVGDLKDFNDFGAAWGAAVAYQAVPRLRIRLDAAGEHLHGANWDNLKTLGEFEPVVRPDAPDTGPFTDLVHLTGGLQLRVNDLGSGWEIHVHAGAGVTFLSAEATEATEGGDFERFTLDGGLELGYAVTPRVRLVGRGDLYAMLSRDAGPSHLGKEITLPFTAGLAVGL